MADKIDKIVIHVIEDGGNEELPVGYNLLGDGTYAQTILALIYNLLNSIDVVSYEGDSSLRIVDGHQEHSLVHMSLNGVSGNTNYMLVDLSDTTNWPHTETGHLSINHIILSINPSTTFQGDILVGFLSNVDESNGDFHQIIALHGDLNASPQVLNLNLGLHSIDTDKGDWFGPTTLNDVAFQTDVLLLGPDGRTVYPSGNGDLVMRLTSSAGTVDIAVTIVYRTVPAS